MKKFYGFVFAVIALIVTGCTASVSGPTINQPPAPVADGRRVVNTTTGECGKGQPGTTEADFNACMASNKCINPETGTCEIGHPGTTDADFTVCLMRQVAWMAATPRSTQQRSATQGAVLPKEGQPLPPPPASPAPPGFQPPPGYYPAATGPSCEVQKGVTLEVTNDTDYYLQVYNPGDTKVKYIVPLNCDAPLSLETIAVMHRNGVVEDGVLAIRPHTTAKFVFMPLNGGWGKGIRVNFKGWMFNRVSDGMTRVPSTEVGLATYLFDVPNISGDRNWISIDPSRLSQKY